MSDKAFVLYHEYADNSGQATIVYVGSDKAAAFDALMNRDEYWSLNELYIEEEGSCPQARQPQG